MDSIADTVLLPFQFIESATKLLRDISAFGINRKLTDIQIENCSRIVNDAQAELVVYNNFFEKVKHIQSLHKDQSLCLLTQSANLVTSLTSTLDTIKEIYSCAGPIAFPTLMKEPLSEFQGQLSDLTGKLERLSSYLNDLHDKSTTGNEDVPTEPDCYKAANMVQQNPNYIFLDFEDPEAPESLLKVAVCDTDSNSTVSAVAHGMGGVGKTSAVRGVGQLEEVKKRFPGGVLFMSLGADAGKFDLIRNLAVFMRETGGHQLAKEVERGDEIPKAVSLTAKWFESYCCLFIIDDIWCQKGIDSTVTVTLARLASHKDSRVVFTTRDIKLESDIPITFKKRGRPTSEKILLHSAGLRKRQVSNAEQSALNTLLDMADGIPITLGVIGSRARHFVQHRNVDPSVVWSEVCKEYEQSNELISEDAFRNEKNEKVLNVLLLSLKMIRAESEEQDYSRLFESLSILQNRQNVPFDVAERMWGLDAKKTRDNIGVLERFSTVEVSHWFKGQQRKCFIVHDLFLDVARHLASLKPGFTASTSKRVLNSYVSPYSGDASTDQNPAAETSSMSTVKKSGGMKFKLKRLIRGGKARGESSTSKEDVSMTHVISSVKNGEFHKAWATVLDDGFARLNLFRLLNITGMHNEGIALLMDPRWVTEQVNCFGRKRFNEDAAIILKHVEQNELRDRYASCAKAIRMVKAAVTASEPHANNAFGGGALWSQLYGRLSNLRTHEFITSFLNAIDEFAPTPWVRSQGVLPVPTASTGKVINIPHVLYLRSTSDCVDIVNCNIEQCLFELHRYFPEEDNARLEKTWNIPHEPGVTILIEGATLSADASTLAVGCGNDVLVFTDDNGRNGPCVHNIVKLRQHKQKVSSVSISADGKSLISGGGDGKVIMWRFTDSVWGSTQLEGHTDDVLSVKMCPNGSKAVSGGKDGTFRMWTQVEGAGWRSEVLEGPSDCVMCIDLSADGRFVVTGSSDEIVRVWEKRGAEWAMSELEGHSYYMNDVALDTNGMRIISASCDNNARLWECRERLWSCTATLEGHSRPVKRAAIGLNGGGMSTSSNDGTVRMWDVARDGWETDRLNGHTDMVWDVAVSGDRQRVVSGSEDGTVLLWEKGGSAWKVDSLKKHSRGVNAVALSSSGKLIVSGSDDATACVFEEQNRRWSSHELTGHTRLVQGVAISLDGKAVATASVDGTVKIWGKTGRSWELSYTLEGHDSAVISVALNRDGSLVVSGSHDRTVRVWDTRRGRLETVGMLIGHEAQVTAVAVTPDGSTICSGDYHGTVELWAQSAAGDWANTTIRNNFEEYVKKLTFSADGYFLRAEDHNGNLIWLANRSGAWAEDSSRGGASATDCGVFGDGRLDRQDWPHCMGQLLEQIARLWNLGDGWYSAQSGNVSIAGVAQIIG